MHDHHPEWEPVAAAGTQRIIAGARAVGSPVALESESGSLNTVFLKDAPEGQILLDTGVRQGAHPLPDTGTPVTLIWLRKQDGYHYRFHSTVTGMIQYHDQYAAIQVACPKTMERTQRRRAYRVPVSLDDAQNLSIRFGDEPGKHTYAAFAHDLSATGARISFIVPLANPELIQKGHEIEAHISMDGVSYGVMAKVVRVEKTGTSVDHEMGRERWMLGVHFVEPFAVFQKNLERYITERQRAALRR